MVRVERAKINNCQCAYRSSPLLLTGSALAGARRFTYVYEATTSPPKSVESETWVTWGTSPADEYRFNSVDFRQEIEVGVTDHFQLSIYLADWGYTEDPAENKHGFDYQDSAVEMIYNLNESNHGFPRVGALWRIRGGPEELELESKFILQKNLGRFVLAYNGTLEAKWEGDGYAGEGGRTRKLLGPAMSSRRPGSWVLKFSTKSIFPIGRRPKIRWFMPGRICHIVTTIGGPR